MKRHFSVILLFSCLLLFFSCDNSSKIKSYKITFEPNSEEIQGTTGEITAVENATIILSACGFTRDGYTFIGWNTKKDGTGIAYADKETLTIVSDLTLYAQWKENPKPKYTIIFEANAEKVTGTTEKIEAEENTALTLTACGFTREGYTFAGWNTKADGSGTGYSDNAKISLTQNLILYAQWLLESVPSYTIETTSVTGGRITVDKSIAVKGAEVTVTVSPDDFYYLNYITIAGKDGTQIQIIQNLSNQNQYTFKMPAKNVIVNVSFKVYSYTVTFNSNNTNATGTTNQVSGQAGTTILCTENGFSLSGYTFTGWNTKPDGTGTSYANKASIKLTGNLNLYAQWVLAKTHCA